ncbi:MAG: DUF4351 domain-containing protein [Candidatus Tectomicrobia bacterium]|uniref:DUF4351 domain-containing protein n=1 Tax=Tectimicrobiota bacterium TaxID=2528274 RepID=A0A937W060_UNCTE|nr:DUF4351 domain-containing protein [Candidatus Tectomicrobia bacterium]
MADHDQRFKVLLQEFFAEFFQLFFLDWAGRFDFTQVLWLDKEVFPDPPQGLRRALDLVARLPVRQVITMPGAEPAESWITLVHVEIEAADTVVPLRRRLFEYYEWLRHQHRLPVLPIGVYLRVGLEGLGWDHYEERFWEHRLVRFDYPYVGLPGLDAMRYLHGANWLGVALAALMRASPTQRAALGAAAWRRLLQCPENEYRRYLLCECVDAYLPVDDVQRQEFETLVLRDPDPGVQQMATTLLERMRQEGRQEGQQEGRQEGTLLGQREFVVMLLTERFGPLSPAVQAQIQTLSAERLAALGRALLTATSLQELGLEA